MYNMSMALSLAALWLGLEWLKEQRLRVGLGFVLAALLALHTHYYTIYILLAFYLFLILFYFPSLNFPSSNFAALCALAVVCTPHAAGLSRQWRFAHAWGHVGAFVECLYGG